MPTQIFYINTRLVYARYLFKYFSYVAHAVPRVMMCWIARAVLRASPHVVYACRACESCISPRVVRVLSRLSSRIARALSRCLRVAAHVVSCVIHTLFARRVIPSGVRATRLVRVSITCVARRPRMIIVFTYKLSC
jgi:hypothetical protein